MIYQEYADYVQDIINAIETINRTVNNKSFEEFEQTETVYYTVERMFEIIGEASNRIPLRIQEEYPQIPWGKMIAMRNRIVHGYDKVNPDIIWNTIKTVIPVITKPLKIMLEELETK